MIKRVKFKLKWNFLPETFEYNLNMPIQEMVYVRKSLKERFAIAWGTGTSTPGKDYFINSLILGKGQEACYCGLQFYLDKRIVIFQYKYTCKEELKISFLRNIYTIKSQQGDVYEANVSHRQWSEAFDIALLLRDKTAQKTLLSILFWHPEEYVDPYDLAFARYQKAYAEKDESIRKELLEEMDLLKDSKVGTMNTNEGVKQVENTFRSSYFKRIMLPIVYIMEAIAADKEEEFNVLLEAYIKDKKKWIAKEKHHDRPQFWVDYRLLACCTLAYDKGMSIKVKSDYIPDFAYTGDYPKTVPDFLEVEKKEEEVKVIQEKEKTSKIEDPDAFEDKDWQAVHFHRFLMSLPRDWTYTIDKEKATLEANKDEEIILSLSLIRLNKSLGEKLPEYLWTYGQAYIDSGYTLAGKIKNAGFFIFAYYSFEGEVVLQLSAMEKKYNDENYVLIYATSADSLGILKNNLQNVYRIHEKVAVELGNEKRDVV